MKPRFAILICLLFQLCFATRSVAVEQSPEWRALTDAGLSAYQRKDLSSAERLLSKAVLKSQSLSVFDPRRAYSIGNLAIVFAAEGRYEEAKPLFVKAIQLVDRSFQGASRLEIRIALRGLAENQYSNPKFRSAERLYLSAQSKLGALR